MLTFAQFVSEKFDPRLYKFAQSTANKLKPDQRRIVRSYTFDAYAPFNDYLRKGKMPSTWEYKREELPTDINTLRSAIAKSRLPKDLLVFRGVSMKELKLGKPNLPKRGDTYKVTQFMSTSTDVSVAWSFSSSSGWTNKNCLFVIKVPKGTRALPIHPNLGYQNPEDEVLFAPGSRFRVDRVEVNKYKDSFKVILTCIGDGF